MEIIISQLFSGLVGAGILFIATAGLSMIFGVAGILNLAHVSLYMIGAYLTFTFCGLFQEYNFSYWLAIPLTCLSLGTIGFLIELIIMRHFYQRNQEQSLVGTYALILISSDIVKLAWGPGSKQITRPEILSKSVNVKGMAYPNSSIFVVIVALAVFFAIWIWLSKTRSGKIVRAAQFDRMMVSALGIPISRIITGVFVISVIIAGIAGATWMSVGTAYLTMDIQLLIQVFCVMIIGGLDSFIGTAVAALIVGEVYALGIIIMPELAIAFLFLVTGIVLVVRPYGLFGTKGRA